MHETPLTKAVFCGHTEIVKMLLSAGADVYERNFEGKTMQEVAAKCIVYAKTKDEKANYTSIIKILNACCEKSKPT